MTDDKSPKEDSTSTSSDEQTVSPPRFFKKSASTPRVPNVTAEQILENSPLGEEAEQASSDE